MSEQLETVKSTLQSQGIHCTDEDVLALIKKNKLIKTVEELLAQGHTRAEIDRTVKQLQDQKAKANNEVH